ncbi:RING finger protein unkempt homolog [Oncorhynchus nerka]|uniref:RING finger protein unkempt homolog n=1 Tax=Oncorhynchus nerka TaxID=8023 RepID=UPI0031B8A7DF
MRTSSHTGYRTRVGRLEKENYVENTYTAPVLVGDYDHRWTFLLLARRRHDVSANVLHVQPEKRQHYTYLKEFRTEQCPLFVQHKCTQHRPFSCFHWHFLNQRRRRPIRRRDGTFNYSPDVYCTKHTRAPAPALMRTNVRFCMVRRYHLRYYKTGSCIHETDGKGHCGRTAPTAPSHTDHMTSMSRLTSGRVETSYKYNDPKSETGSLNLVV